MRSDPVRRGSPGAAARAVFGACLLLFALAPVAAAQERTTGTRAPRTQSSATDSARAESSDPLDVELPRTWISSLERPQAPPLAARGVSDDRGGWLRVAPSLGVSQEYSDSFQGDDGEPASNHRSQLSPQLAVYADRGTARLDLDYRLDGRRDSISDSLSADHSASGRLSGSLGPRLRFALAGRFLQSDEASQADVLGLHHGRDAFERSQLRAELQYRLPGMAAQLAYRRPRFERGVLERTRAPTLEARVRRSLGESTTLELSYAHLSSDSSNCSPPQLQAGAPPSAAERVPCRSDLDQEVRGGQWSLGFSRQLGALGWLGLVTSFSERESERTVVTNPREDSAGSLVWDRRRERGESQTWSVLPTWTLPARRGVSATLSLGWSQLREEDGASWSRPLAIGALRYRRGRLDLELRAAQGLSETFATGADFGVVETRSADLSLGWALAPRLELELSAFAQRSETLGDVEGAELRRRLGVSAGIEWTVSPKLALFAELSHTQFWSEPIGGPRAVPVVLQDGSVVLRARPDPGWDREKRVRVGARVRFR